MKNQIEINNYDSLAIKNFDHNNCYFYFYNSFWRGINILCIHFVVYYLNNSVKSEFIHKVIIALNFKNFTQGPPQSCSWIGRNLAIISPSICCRGNLTRIGSIKSLGKSITFL